MIEFLWPFAFALLPLPFLVRWLMPAVPSTAAGALRVPFFARLAASVGQAPAGRGRNIFRLVMASLIWLALVAALARPVWIGDEVPLPVEGRDLMMAIDLSGSMEEQDFALDGRPATRLDVVKEVAQDFIARREGDRVGLVLFSDRAYLQAPLTFDRETVSALLEEAKVGLTGQKTAIGDAIAVSARRLRDRPAESKVLILLTDGESNAGTIEPLEAAELARELGIRIYTIGVGSGQRRVQTPFGTRVVAADGPDEATLRRIADITGGKYFRARDVAGLARVYAELDRLEPVEDDPQMVRPSVSLFHVPLAGGLLLTFLLAAAMLAPGLRVAGRAPNAGAATDAA